MTQSVDDMFVNKIVTNHPSRPTNKNCDKSSIHFGTYRFFSVTYRLGQMRLVTNRQSLMSQVKYYYYTPNYVLISGRYVSKQKGGDMPCSNKHESSYISDTTR